MYHHAFHYSRRLVRTNDTCRPRHRHSPNSPCLISPKVYPTKSPRRDTEPTPIMLFIFGFTRITQSTRPETNLSCYSTETPLAKVTELPSTVRTQVRHGRRQYALQGGGGGLHRTYLVLQDGNGFLMARLKEILLPSICWHVVLSVGET